MTHRWPAFLLLIVFASDVAAAEGEIRLNQIQVIGTHNSYHIAPAPSILKWIAAAGPKHAESLDYSHRPLSEQFSRLGIRQVELDVFADPKGGLYAEPMVRAILRKAGKDPGPDPDEGGRLRRPGFKVFHVQDVDYQSTVPTFLDALREIKRWSAAHPKHVPILVLIELKDEAQFGLRTRPAPFTKTELDALDADILSIFQGPSILRPDDVRGEAETLPEALRTRGWPTLESSRGKVLFALDNGGKLRDQYLEGHPALRGRVMFVSVDPEHPAAAWMKVNDAVADFERIQSLVRAGFLVRTRADADTNEARHNDGSRRDKAFASGAQFVSTDYPEPRPEFSGYVVRLPGHVPARLNPINAAAADAGILLDDTSGDEREK